MGFVSIQFEKNLFTSIKYYVKWFDFNLRESVHRVKFVVAVIQLIKMREEN